MVKIKKWLAIMAIIFLIIPNVSAGANYNASNAQAYLAAHSDNPWSVMALTMLGQTPASTSFLASVSGKNRRHLEALPPSRFFLTLNYAFRK
ncbi:hypothetical protein KKE99_03375 [Patescibacteria group bacterium]|nr:hypothetical protein [Patescibacteria group bacterium]